MKGFLLHTPKMGNPSPNVTIRGGEDKIACTKDLLDDHHHPRQCGQGLLLRIHRGRRNCICPLAPLGKASFKGQHTLTWPL